jgi:dihydromethanopterin reductase (acceptor)
VAKDVVTPRLGWALTGSGHYFVECLTVMRRVPHLDIFVTKAAAEVIRMYKKEFELLPPDTRVFKDTTASAAPVGNFYKGQYHGLVVAPATSNTVATNVYAQAGKCRVPSVVFACDTAPEMDTEAPSGWVKVYPRRIDLDNTERLKQFEYTTVVETLAALEAAVDAMLRAAGQA